MTMTQHAATTDIAAAVAAMGEGPLVEAALVEHVHPLFSRVLAGERERGEIYLSNHSLGRPLDRMGEDVAEFCRLWYSDMDGAWETWLATQDRFRALMAQLIGCADPKAVVPRVSAAQGLRAILNALPAGKGAGVNRPVRVVSTSVEFDSIDWVLRGYQSKGRADVAWVAPDDQALVHADAIVRAIREAEEAPDLVVVSQVYFSTGQVLENIESVIAAAHERGSLVCLDTYHHAGVYPGVFEALGADFAIGGNYKYTRGGPGAGWMAIAPHISARDDIDCLDTGWFAKADFFGFGRGDEQYAEGGDGWLEATPAIITAYQALSGLELVLALGIQRLRDYSARQQGYMADQLASQSVETRLIEPRGAFLLIPQDDPAGAVSKIKAAGVSTDGRRTRTGDGRTLGHVRVCPDILTTEADMQEAARRIAGALA